MGSSRNIHKFKLDQQRLFIEVAHFSDELLTDRQAGACPTELHPPPGESESELREFSGERSQPLRGFCEICAAYAEEA